MYSITNKRRAYWDSLKTKYLGKNNPAYKHGKSSIAEGNKCCRCNILIDYSSTYCRSCAALAYYDIKGRMSNDQKNQKYREYQKTLSRKEQHRQYISNKYKSDVSYKLTVLLRTREYLALKGICKSDSTLNLLGCSIEKLKQHLESQFKDGMTWGNYGSGYNGKGMMQVDHIIPCCKFNLSNPEEQKKCFYYTNLQPLWAEENLRKNGE